MPFEIQLRGVMLLEMATIRGQQYLYRILIPRARTQQDKKENWVHPDHGKARAHSAGVVLQRGTPKKCNHQSLDSLSGATLGTGTDLPLLPTAVATGLPVVTELVAGYDPRRSAYIEILPRGAGSVQLGQAIATKYKLAGSGSQSTPLTHFNAKIVFDQVPQHAFAHLPAFATDDIVAIYNFDFADPTPDELNEMHPVPRCEDIEDDDDFYWVYGMFANPNGDKIPLGRLMIPVPDCARQALDGSEGVGVNPAHVTPRVSSCFLGLV